MLNIKIIYVTKAFLLAIILSILSVTSGYAWLRPSYEDAEIVDRSELIVAGHLKPDSIQYILHNDSQSRGMSWEYHAMLNITEVIKGKNYEKGIPIIIHYGLTPVVGSYSDKGRWISVYRNNHQFYANDTIGIEDTGNSAMSLEPYMKEVEKDNLWFLRKRSGIYGREPGSGNYGVVDPQDIQPLELKKYFQAYLSKNEELSVGKYVKEHPEMAKRVQNYLDHLEIQRILKTPSQQDRYEKLLPYYLKGSRYGMKQEARDGIIGCGHAAGENLFKLFVDEKNPNHSIDIIRILTQLDYKEAAPAFIELLKKDDKFWDNQHLEKGWWNQDVGSELSEKRRSIYGEIYYIVCALNSFKDPSARDAIEITKKRWQDSDVGNGQIREVCDAYLHDLLSK